LSNKPHIRDRNDSRFAPGPVLANQHPGGSSNTYTDRAVSTVSKFDRIRPGPARRKKRTNVSQTTRPIPTRDVGQLAADIAELHFTRAEREAPRRALQRATLAVGAPPRLLSALGASETDNSEEEMVSSLEAKAALRGWNFGSFVRRGEVAERIVP